MAWRALTSGLLTEVRSSPVTSLFALLSLSIFGAIMSFILPLYLEVGEVNARVRTLEFGSRRQFAETLENRLQLVRAARFDLKAQIEQIEAHGRAIDRIYYDELKRLDAEEYSDQRRLSIYLTANPDLASP
jgi:hypothetical protein